MGAEAEATPPASVTLVCLLPVRNGAADLPGHLASIASVCDAVVALDDGSTDDTREILEAHPSVRVLLTNPPRETFAGWHDGSNRARLLEAACEVDPDWIISIDADERIPEADGRALREFLMSDALPGIAYGFQHVRMWGDAYDPDCTWVYRLFAYDKTLTFPKDRLHFPPVPVEITRERWIRTTLRIQHLGAVDEEQLRRRHQKYAQADPGREYTNDHGGLSKSPARTVPFNPERTHNDVLFPGG